MNEQVSTAFRKWLSGTTCKRLKQKIVWVSLCNRFAVFKHVGHSEYVGRQSTVYCPTYYALFDVENLQPNFDIGHGWLWRQTGRWHSSFGSQVNRSMREVLKNDRSKV